MSLTYLFTSGIEVDNGITLPAASLIPQTVTKQLYYGALNSGSVPLARTLFTVDGSSSYQVVGVTATWNTVGSQSFMLVQASGSTQVGSGAPLLNSGINTYPADTPAYGNLINSTALQTIPPGNTLAVRGTLNGLDPEGVFEVVLAKIN